jgi:hypothetical protein
MGLDLYSVSESRVHGVGGSRMFGWKAKVAGSFSKLCHIYWPCARCLVVRARLSTRIRKRQPRDPASPRDAGCPHNTCQPSPMRSGYCSSLRQQRSHWEQHVPCTHLPHLAHRLCANTPVRASSPSSSARPSTLSFPALPARPGGSTRRSARPSWQPSTATVPRPRTTSRLPSRPASRRSRPPRRGLWSSSSSRPALRSTRARSL